MDKKYSVFITVLFCLFIFGFGLAHLAAPDQEFSQQENRYLALFQPPTLSTLKEGEFMEDFEDYIVDQFPLRDWWISLKAWGEKLLGKHENNGVYLGLDGQTLFAQYTRPTSEELAERVGYVNALADNVDVPVYFALIPDKSYGWAYLLPDNAPNVDDGSVIKDAGPLCGDNVNWIDLTYFPFSSETFYRTDHHWTTMGAYQGYLMLMNAMNGSATTLDYEPTLVSDTFYGTTWSSSGATWVAPDKIYTWVNEEDFTVTSYLTGEGTPSSLYDESFLDKKDKYSMFLGGNQPLCVIENADGQQGRLLVVRDSYTDSLAPFLALDYQEVHLWDLRHNRSSLAQYVAENEIDQVLVLYSNANFATDSNLFFMSR